MNIEKYFEEADRTLTTLSKEYEYTDSLHMVMGMMTESAEIVDVFKKNLAYNTPINWVNVVEELGDLMWYIVNFCKLHDIDFKTVLKINNEKLKIRYPEKFSEESATKRDLEKENEILQKNYYEQIHKGS